jgi:branched-chain amino acid transport system ATP-binding protein
MFDGQSVLGRKPHEINQMGISRVFQTPEIFTDLTVHGKRDDPLLRQARRAFRMHALERSSQRDRRSSRRPKQMLEDVNMLDKRDMHCRLAVARRQAAAGMAMCLVQEPKLLLLDEPTAGMARADTNNTIDLLKQIKRQARHHHGHHRTRHARGVQPRRADHRARPGHAAGRGHAREHQGHPKVQEAYLGGAH